MFSSLFLQAAPANNPFTETYFIISFAVLVVVMLIIDLGVFNKKTHKITNREAITWSGIWIGLAIVFGFFVYMFLGVTKASEFYTAYIIEKALSVDNLFVFILVFNFFRVPTEYHHKVLFWGIIGAIFLRAIFIFSGAGLIKLTYLPTFTVGGIVIEEMNIILTIFGLFLIYAGIKSLGADDDEEKDFSNSLGIKIVKKLFPVTEKYDGGKFFTWENGKKMATMLLVVVGVIEVTDVIFAVDSIPAIFTVSKDPFILYSSNIFAILGLRTLYFLLANFMHLFAYLKYGLAFVLSFIGAKMVIAPFFHISSPVSLSVVAGVLIFSVVASLIWGKKEEAADNSEVED
jgi:tellurite resistance protein TerC